MAESKKTVLMTHLDLEQGEIWQTALAHQGVEVIWDTVNLDLVEHLSKLQELSNLPDLLLMDSGVKSPKAEVLQSGSVCQWISKYKVPLKVILFNPRNERIKDVEYNWATRRGASDLLPRLSGENLVSLVSKVTDTLGCNFVQDPIERIADQMFLQKSSSEPAKPNPKDLVQADVSGQVVAAVDPDDSGFMYRGVRIRR
jgi:hypothetical protein